MCNLYSSTTASEAMRQMFAVRPELDQLGNAEPLPAIWPKYPGHVVRLTEDGERELTTLSWGFRTTNKSKKTGKILQPAAWNNARDDKVASSGLWKHSFQHRRCLIPATSFCEAKGRSPATYFWFALKGDEARPPFAFAGMWQLSRFEAPDGPDECATYTMITTTANDLVRPIHPTRMPVILRPDDYDRWLDGSPGDALDLLRPYPADEMRIVQRGEDAKSDPS
ncbi:SOS response-associated peptidase [Pukyongiella litopenaei]|uniref:Abasic site processing protein n=1 Tax=Pukyongiella litopenaei TaxID=2605946 RepID=A0A2S0ML20_9RHOB|nr:SOS response-associated peptidase [Pukyongiella litopenaei]AVO36580.1 SOS response-associated peptidase [Pukyongiella litopenaei]